MFLHDLTKFANKPETQAIPGFKPMTCAGPWSFWPADGKPKVKIDPAQVVKVAQGVPAGGKLLLDIEAGGPDLKFATHQFYTHPLDIFDSLTWYNDTIVAPIRKAVPALPVGIYGIMPADNTFYWGVGPRFDAVCAAWDKALMTHPISKSVTFLAPAFYPYGGDGFNWDTLICQAKGIILRAKAYRRTIIPCVSPQYQGGPKSGQQVEDLARWRQLLTACRAGGCSGVAVWYYAPKETLADNAEWVTIAKEFA